MHVTVFGGSEPKPGDSTYDEALLLGSLLGSGGHTVLTGGYMGTMEAVSRGVVEAGGHTIGVTSDEIEAWRQNKPNGWIQEEKRFKTTRERLFALIEGCDVALALPGGVGTLAEVAMMWSLLQTKAISSRRLILIGPAWKQVIDAFLQQFDRYVRDDHRKIITFVPDVDTAVLQLES
jgi:uncharacterized protein (TIGR00730 family)